MGEDRVDLRVESGDIVLDLLELLEHRLRALDLARVAARLHALLELRDDFLDELRAAAAAGREIALPVHDRGADPERRVLVDAPVNSVLKSSIRF